MLEARAGQLATERMTTEDADAVDRLVDLLDTAVRNNKGLNDYALLNEQFHERFYQSCHRKYLRRQIRMLRDAVAPLIRILASEVGELQRAQDEHRKMARFFRRGDAIRVGELCRRHCAYTGAALVERFLMNGKSVSSRNLQSTKRGRKSQKLTRDSIA